MPRYSQEIKDRAVELRRNGYSINEISKVLGMAKSTVSLWTIKEPLSIRAQARLKYGHNKGVRKGINTRQKRLSIIYNSIQAITQEHVANLTLDINTQRLLVSTLYWGEGAKTGRQIRIINSDPVFIKVFLELFRQCFNLDESRFAATLHLHEYHNREDQLQFWSKVTKIPKNRIGIYLKPNTGIQKKIDYPGCIAVHYYDAKIFDIITAYYKLFSESMGA